MTKLTGAVTGGNLHELRGEAYAAACAFFGHSRFTISLESAAIEYVTKALTEEIAYIQFAGEFTAEEVPS